MRWDDTIWPFASGPGTPSLSSSLPDFSKVHFAQIFVYNDSRNWGRDAQIITDVAASQDGCIYNPKDIKDSSQWTADKQVCWTFARRALLVRLASADDWMTRTSQLRFLCIGYVHVSCARHLLNDSHAPTRATPT